MTEKLSFDEIDDTTDILSGSGEKHVASLARIFSLSNVENRNFWIYDN